jgi:hypothetical protein
VVSPDRRILRTGLRPMPRSRLIRLLLLPSTKWSRRTFAVVSKEIIPALASGRVSDLVEIPERRSPSRVTSA